MNETTAAPRRSSALFITVVVVLLAALAVEGFLLLQARRLKRPAEAQAAIAAGQSQQVEEFGDPKAPIKIEFYAPLVLEWHQKTIGLLRAYHERHPNRLHVKLMPMGQAECDAEMQRRGYTCAVIFINGKNEFKLSDGRSVTLYQRPNQSTSTYNSEDVITILDQLAGGQPK